MTTLLLMVASIAMGVMGLLAGEPEEYDRLVEWIAGDKEGSTNK